VRRPVPLLIACAALISCEAPDTKMGVEVEDARITLPAVRGRPGAAYFTIRAARPVVLSGVSSPRAQRIELHESMAAGMAPLQELSLQAGDRLEFAAAGKHAMLFGVDPRLKEGEQAPLTFTFQGAPPVTVQADVLGPGGAHGEH
jgi:hypothetical protein